MSTEKISEKAKQLRRDYQNEWRRRNKDKVKRYNAEYWERRAIHEQEAEQNVK